MTWTQFWDMHSGGGTKEGNFNHIYIEAESEAAQIIFQNKFGHNPNRVSCTCCGPDYSISSESTLEALTGYERGCAWDDTVKSCVERPDTDRFSKKYMTLDEYLTKSNVLVIRASDITPDMYEGELRESGYVWRD